jgi:transcriptional regulator with XRE-family HTH domain
MQKKKKILVQFGDNVRNARLAKNLSQEALADLAGLHRTYIGMIERAEKNVTLVSIEKIAIALGARPNDLIYFDNGK